MSRVQIEELLAFNYKCVLVNIFCLNIYFNAFKSIKPIHESEA